MAYEVKFPLECKEWPVLHWWGARIRQFIIMNSTINDVVRGLHWLWTLSLKPLHVYHMWSPYCEKMKRNEGKQVTIKAVQATFLFCFPHKDFCSFAAVIVHSRQIEAEKCKKILNSCYFLSFHVWTKGFEMEMKAAPASRLLSLSKKFSFVILSPRRNPSDFCFLHILRNWLRLMTRFLSFHSSFFRTKFNAVESNFEFLKPKRAILFVAVGLRKSNIKSFD